MKKRILRNSLFGFNKSDVLDYISQLDEKAEERINEKSAENERLRAEIDSMKEELSDAKKNRDAIVSVLELAQKNAKEIVDNARVSAEEIENKARVFAETEKINLNREIEMKRREMDNQLLGESKKINKLRKEVEELRKASVLSIKKFEKELYDIESALEIKQEFSNKASEEIKGETSERFFDSLRTVPIRIVKAASDDK